MSSKKMDFPFLNKIKDRTGYAVISKSGEMIKSEGDLANRTDLIDVVRSMLLMQTPTFTESKKIHKKFTTMHINIGYNKYIAGLSGDNYFLVKTSKVRPVPPTPNPSPASSVSSLVHPM